MKNPFQKVIRTVYCMSGEYDKACPRWVWWFEDHQLLIMGICLFVFGVEQFVLAP